MDCLRSLFNDYDRAVVVKQTKTLKVDNQEMPVAIEPTNLKYLQAQQVWGVFKISRHEKNNWNGSKKQNQRQRVKQDVQWTDVETQKLIQSLKIIGRDFNKLDSIFAGSKSKKQIQSKVQQLWSQIRNNSDQELVDQFRPKHEPPQKQLMDRVFEQQVRRLQAMHHIVSI